MQHITGNEATALKRGQAMSGNQHSNFGNASDPILEAIERHRAAYIAWMSSLHLKITSGEKENPKAHKAERRFYDAAEKAADNLAEVLPTTMQGIVALLAYIDDVNCDRMLPQNVRYRDDLGGFYTKHNDWPDWERGRNDVPTNANGEQPTETWPLRVMRNIKIALEDLREKRAAA